MPSAEREIEGRGRAAAPKRGRIRSPSAFVKPEKPRRPCRIVAGMRVAPGPVREFLCGIRLMTDIPDQPVMGACRRRSAAPQSARRPRGWRPKMTAGDRKPPSMSSARNSSARLSQILLSGRLPQVGRKYQSGSSNGGPIGKSGGCWFLNPNSALLNVTAGVITNRAALA